MTDDGDEWNDPPLPSENDTNEGGDGPDSFENPALVNAGTLITITSLPAFVGAVWLALTGAHAAWIIAVPILTALFGLIIAGLGAETPPAEAAEDDVEI